MAYSSSQKHLSKIIKSKNRSSTSLSNLDFVISTSTGVDFDFTNPDAQTPNTENSKNENQSEKYTYSKTVKCTKEFLVKVCEMYSTYLENSKNKPKNNIYGTFEYYEQIGDTYYGALKDKEVILFAE